MSHSASALRSIQIIAGRTGWHARSTGTSPSSCEANAIAATRSAGISRMTSPSASVSADTHSRGSCSAHPGRGYER